MPFCRRVWAVTAVTAIGTFWMFCAVFWAVTITSATVLELVATGALGPAVAAGALDPGGLVSAWAQAPPAVRPTARIAGASNRAPDASIVDEASKDLRMVMDIPPFDRCVRLTPRAVRRYG